MVFCQAFCIPNLNMCTTLLDVSEEKPTQNHSWGHQSCNKHKNSNFFLLHPLCLTIMLSSCAKIRKPSPKGHNGNIFLTFSLNWQQWWPALFIKISILAWDPSQHWWLLVSQGNFGHLVFLKMKLCLSSFPYLHD